MIAGLQRILVACWLLALTAVVLHLAVAERSAAIWWAMLALLLAGHAIVLALEFLLMARINRTQPTGALPIAHLRAWASECLHAPLVFGWRQPFQSTRWPDAIPATSHRQRGVVLVHGLVCNRGLWTTWLSRLHARKIPVVALNLEPPWGPIERYAPMIEAAVRRLEAATGLAPVLVGHSMGGIAIRNWWVNTTVDRAHHAITLGSPHHGTFLACLSGLPNVRQMRLNAPWLQQLANQEGPDRRARTTCFFSCSDNIVFPADTATLQGADNRQLLATAHVHMVSHDEPWVELLVRLAQPNPTRPEGGPAPAAGA